MKSITLGAGVLLLLASMESPGQQAACSGPQLGTWKLQSQLTEDLETHKKQAMFGAHPGGYLHYGADCRMYAILVREDRKPPAAAVATDAESVELFRGLAAYAGTYTIEGDKVSHHVDISWNQAWTGTTQVRQFRIEGKYLYIHTMPAASPLNGRRSSTELVWKRVE
jgi:hypothetical protein